MKKLFYVIRSYIPIWAVKRLQRPYHFFLSLCGAVWYWFPSRKLTVIGVTGTKGKTTVVELLHSILEAHDARVASISSLRFRIDQEEQLNTLGMTMPGRFFLQHFFSRAHTRGCTYAIVEVTSQGIEQYRHRFVDFDMGVFTNISPEHIEAHGGFEPYLRAKLDFFWRLPRRGIAVINRDDAQANRVSATCRSEKAWYSRTAIDYKKHTWPIRNYHNGSFGVMFDVGGHQIRSRLQGDINAENIFAAVATALALRIPIETISRGIAEVNEVSGRMQIIQEKPFRVVVDYAHTPDSLERVYKSLERKEGQGESCLICVLGAAGGGRDIWKRPEFGKIAADHCREIFITNEDPFDESPESIMEDIALGVRQSGYMGILQIVSDRREAIRIALTHARDTDTVIITGKGSESYIRGARGKRTQWSDADVAREELAHD